MLPARPHLSITRLSSRFLLLWALVSALAPSYFSTYAQAPATAEILPLSEIRPGMQGYAYTIFAGNQVEKFDLEVVGVMPNSRPA
jgi:hypothetical protein